MPHRETNSQPHVDRIAQVVVVLRGQRVILDRDLAEIFQVTTKRLNESVQRNLARFPTDFMFQLTNHEVSNLRSQIATSSWGGGRYRPFAFTEHGAIQAANVLRSPLATMMGIHVVRAFVRMRQLLNSNRELEQRFTELERRISGHDEAIDDILEAIRRLMDLPATPSKPIGFTAKLDD